MRRVKGQGAFLRHHVVLLLALGCGGRVAEDPDATTDVGTGEAGTDAGQTRDDGATTGDGKSQDGGPDDVRDADGDSNLPCGAIRQACCPTAACVGGAPCVSGICVEPPDAAPDGEIDGSPGHGVVVLFGGTSSTGDLHDTWSFDGAGWSRLVSPTSKSPSPRQGAGLADLGSSLILFGGQENAEFLGDTWRFDGTWSHVATVHSPPARAFALLSGTGGSVVLFGGLGPPAPGAEAGAAPALLSDTWTFDGTDWMQVPSAIEPTAREALSGVSFGSGALMFGGSTATVGAASDTWMFSQSSWNQIQVSGPPGRCAAGLASLGGRAVLFGGSNGQGGANSLLGDTWTFDGSNWFAVQSTGPSARDYPGMAALGMTVVLFGGASQAPTADTWTFDGVQWTSVCNQCGPTARSGEACLPLDDCPREPSARLPPLRPRGRR
jgi:hypothetical protein